MVSTIAAHQGSRGPGRPREFDLNEVLDKAIVVFSEQGYHATSISDLTAATEMTAGSIYKAFNDKRAVFLAALDRYLFLRNERLQHRLVSTRSGRDRVEAVLSLYAEYSHDAEGRRGCLVVGSAVELSTSDADVAHRVNEVFRRYEKRLVDFVRQGQDDGSIPAHINGPAAARLLLCVIQGMRVVGKTGRTKQDMRSLVKIAMKVLT